MLPTAVFASHDRRRPDRFPRSGLRSHTDGCGAANPSRYVKGWLVREEFRKPRRWARIGINARRLRMGVFAAEAPCLGRSPNGQVSGTSISLKGRTEVEEVRL